MTPPCMYEMLHIYRLFINKMSTTKIIIFLKIIIIIYKKITRYYLPEIEKKV